jgi:hypothetical protein
VIPTREIAWPVPKTAADATTPVSTPSSISRRAWLAVPLLALAFVAVTAHLRLERIVYVSDVAGRTAPPPGKAGAWQPHLIVPGHHNESYEWLDQTFQMMRLHDWRVRHVDYEDAPGGHDVFSASVYRWWLGAVAAAHTGFTRAHLGPSVEWAALYADPILLVLLGVATTAFVAWRYGPLAAALAAASLGMMFPLGTEFLPGVPDDKGLALVCIIWSILPVLAGAVSTGKVRDRWFAWGGVAGGIGLWVSVASELPVLLGLGAGALAAARLARPVAGAAPEEGSELPWRLWSRVGAATCLGAYLLEFFPSHMAAWELRAIHPIFGVAWLGGGELVALGAGILGRTGTPRGIKGVTLWVLAALGAASLPVTLWIGHSLGFLSLDLPSMRLTLLPNGASAANLWAWLLQNGFTGAVAATVLPLVVVLPAVVLLCLPSRIVAKQRIPIALALGPVVLAGLFAVRQISWWNGVDATLVALIVATAAAAGSLPKQTIVSVAAGVLAALFLAPGAAQLWPAADERMGEGLSQTEVIGLVERDLAYWLAQHAGAEGAVVLAPPNETATLYYYGGMRGLASFGWDNSEGFQAAVRIASATTPEEAQELIGIHGVTHIVIPLWDPFMDAYAQIGEGQVEGTFLARLHQWNLPPWLKPVPYLLPTIGGFEGQSVVILEVVDEQDDATAASRLVQYFIDMQQMDLATKAGVRLRRFPADLGALLARAQLEVATSENGEYADTVNLLLRRVGAGADRALPWDQRVNLAILLAQTHHVDLARTRMIECIGQADSENLRALSTTSLYRMQVLRKAFGLEIQDPKVREEAALLLPADLRNRLGQ